MPAAVGGCPELARNSGWSKETRPAAGCSTAASPGWVAERSASSGMPNVVYGLSGQPDQARGTGALLGSAGWGRRSGGDTTIPCGTLVRPLALDRELSTAACLSRSRQGHLPTVGAFYLQAR